MAVLVLAIASGELYALIIESCSIKRTWVGHRPDCSGGGFQLPLYSVLIRFLNNPASPRRRITLWFFICVTGAGGARSVATAHFQEAGTRMGRLTTHVLDTALGRPGAGVGVTLYRVSSAAGREQLGVFATNADGRCDKPLLEGDAFKVGTYELVFAAGAYFDHTGQALPNPKYLDEVTIRFG